MADATAAHDDWSAPVHVDDWSDPVHHDAGTRDHPLDDTAHAAGPGTIARASLPPDPKVQMQRYAEAFKQPLSDFGIVGDHIVRKVPETGQYARVEPSVRGATGPIDAAKRAFDWIAGGAGPAIPAVAAGAAATAAAILATPETAGAGALPAAMAASGAGASAGEIARQKLDAALAPKGQEADMDWKNVGWQGAAGLTGPLIGKGVEALGSRVAPVLASAAADELPEGAILEKALMSRDAAPVAGNAASFGLSPRVVDALKSHISGKEDELAQLRKDAQSMGVDLSLGQLTGSEAVKQSERQLLRQPETVQSVVDLRNKQNTEQIPSAVRSVLDDVAPDAPSGKQVGAFRDAADAVVAKDLGERGDMAEYNYGPAFQGGSIAPLEDQFRQATIQATAQKGQIAKQIADIERNQSGSLAARGAAGADTRAKYAALREQASEVEEARQAMLERFKQAQADKTANAPGAIWSPRIQQFLDDPIGKAGLQRGLTIQRLEALAQGKPFNPTEYAITGTAEDGTPQVGAVPNMRLLDAWKKGADAIIQDNTDATTGKVNELGRAMTLAKTSFLKEVDAINPDYGVARAQFGSDSDALNAIKDGGVGFLNKMNGPDRQNMVNRVFSGQNLMADDISAMRRQFAYAGKMADWNGGVRSYIADKLADAVAPLKQGGEASNVAGSLYKSLFEERQSNILKAAMGGDANDATIARWNQLGRVLKAASNQLPEGSSTATDLNAPGLARRGVQALKYVLHPASAGADLMDGLSKMQDPATASKLAETLLTPAGDKLLKSLSTTTPGTAKANSILHTMLTQAGIVEAEGLTARAAAAE